MQADARSRASARLWRAEIAETVKLALPIALTQLGQIAMMTTDLALIGRLGDGAVAAVALAHTDPVLRLRARHGARFGGRAARRAGFRRAQAAHGAPRAARRACGPRSCSAFRSTSLQLWGEDILLAPGSRPRPRRSPRAISPASLGR